MVVERKKVRAYRKTLQDLARNGGPDKALAGKALEGKAAKLGIEIYGEERKGKPRTKATGKPL